MTSLNKKLPIVKFGSMTMIACCSVVTEDPIIGLSPLQEFIKFWKHNIVSIGCI